MTGKVKIAVVGNRTGWTKKEVFDVLKLHIGKSDKIVSGGAIGVDTFAQQYAEHTGLEITIFYPDMTKPSPQRYYERNQDIVDYSDKVIAFQNNQHKSGTQSTINRAKKKGIDVLVIKPLKKEAGSK